MTDLNPEDRALTPEVLAIHQWIRDDAPVSIKMIITPKLISALAGRLQAARTEGRRSGEAWKPIETAEPADGKSILVKTADNPPIVGEAWWRRADEGADLELWWANTSPGDYYSDPIIQSNQPVTHWMPMPSADDAGWVAPPVEAKPAEEILLQKIRSAEVCFAMGWSDGYASARKGPSEGECMSEALDRERGAIVGLLTARDEAALPEPVAWKVHGAGAAMLMHDEPKNGVAPGLTITPLYAHPATGTDELPADVVRLVKAATKSRDQFYAYVESHRAKGTADGNAKADTNLAFADMLDLTLTPFSSRAPLNEGEG